MLNYKGKVLKKFLRPPMQNLSLSASQKNHLYTTIIGLRIDALVQLLNGAHVNI